MNVIYSAIYNYNRKISKRHSTHRAVPFLCAKDDIYAHDWLISFWYRLFQYLIPNKAIGKNEKNNGKKLAWIAEQAEKKDCLATA